MAEQPRSYKERAAEFVRDSYYEITNGFPFNGAELKDLLISRFLSDQVSRMPIIALVDGRVFIQTNFLSGKLEHRVLAEKLASEGINIGIDSAEGILFTSGIEIFSMTRPDKGHYIEFSDTSGQTFFWEIKDCSDYPPYANTAASRTQEGLTLLRELLESASGIQFIE